MVLLFGTCAVSCTIMRTRKILILGQTALLTISLTSCAESFEPKTDGGSDIVLTKSQETILQAENAFGIDLFKNIYAGENIVLSPFSVSTMLSMLANGADGETYAGLSRFLGFEDKTVQEVNDYYRMMYKHLTGADSDTKVMIANSFWMDRKLGFRSPFKSVLEKCYDSYNKSVDIDSVATGQNIGKWVSNNTDGVIDDFDLPYKGASFVLANTVFFKSRWEKETTEWRGNFTNVDGDSRSRKFFATSDVACYNGNDASVCILPYASGAYSFVVMMPNEGDLGSFIEGLDSRRFDELLNSAKLNMMCVARVPEFEISADLSNTDMSKAVGNMGMAGLLGSKADFSKLFEEQPENSRLEVCHYASITVDKDGTTAAAVTAAMLLGAAHVTRTYIDFNRPFVFAVRENATGAILFIGANAY